MTNDVFLITSGAYSNDELSSDFGMLPTSFLPVGHKRLIELQMDLISSFSGRKILTLPEKFILSERDKKLIEINEFRIHRSNPNLTLNQSISCFLKTLDFDSSSSLFILHGDTLFDKIDYQLDSIYFGKTALFYKWGDIQDFKFSKSSKNESNLRSVLSGYFTFSNIPLLSKVINATTSFENALKSYNKNTPFNFKESNDWLDFGHSNLYYKSKRNLNVTRNFNSASIVKNHIKKQSNNKEKLKSEYEWFKQLPSELKAYVPSVWDFCEEENKSSYMIEFIGAPTLQEKFVFGNLPDYTYYNIIDTVFNFIEKEKTYTQYDLTRAEIKKSLKSLYISKTFERLNIFLEQVNFDIDAPIYIDSIEYKSLNKFKYEVLNDLNLTLDNIPESFKLTLMHGDLCFSNILYDLRSNSLKLIDPRGGLNNAFDEKIKIFGDYKYDIAKLGHSLIGNYDFIVAGFYKLNYDLDTHNFDFSVDNNLSKSLENYFYFKVTSLGVSKIFIKASIANLFLSMLPLHSEDKDRQVALLINAYKFYYN